MPLPRSAFKFTLHFAKQQWLKFAFIIFSSLIWAANDVVFPYFIKQFVDTLSNYTGAREEVYGALKSTLILFVAFWITTDVITRLQGFVNMYAFPQYRARIRHSVLKYVNAHSHEYFSQNFAGNIAKKLADLPTSCQAMLEIIFYNFITAGFGAVLVVIMMYQANPLFAGIVIVWLILHLGLTILFLRRGQTLWSEHADALSILNGKIVDIFTNIISVRLFSRSNYELFYLKNFQTTEIKKAKKAMRLIEMLKIGLGWSGLFLVFSIIFGLIYEWQHARVTVGDFAQVGMQAFWLLGWIWFITFQMTIYVREAGTVDDSLALIRRPHELIDIPEAQSLRVEEGTIKFVQVNFAYNKKYPVFDNLNIVIPGGKKVGLVGFSGSGKTTLVNLLLRFYDLDSGKILIDKQDIAKVQQASLRENIAMIPQDPSLFHRTLMENIRYGRLPATDEEVIHAAQLAHCHEFIEKLDKGYNTLVGERGIKLSGGQRQRVAIARAILKDAPILILDEATSSLDSVTEKLIQESLRQLMKDRTTLVIAHRLSTLADMDWILVFDQGKIVEQGTQESLLANESHFAQLWQMQVNGFLPDKVP